ncbi:MAG: glycosyl hydrolase [Fibrobacter sp.]|nr:glycosyl hydrolase [Fibrobacter sp.]
MKKILIPAALASAMVASAATVTVNPTATKQTVIGFGGGSVYYQNWIANLSDDDQKDLFDTAFNGLNLSILRIGNWLQSDGKMANAKDSLADDLAIIKAGKERLGDHMKIEMSSWSAPGSLKGSNNVNGNAANGDSTKASLKTASGDKYGAYAYTDFANWWKKSLETYATLGITPDYISFQNEPDMFAGYEETLFDPTETSRKAGYKQALNAIYDAFNGMSNRPKILGPEPLGIGYNNFQKYLAELDQSKLDGYAYHLYHAGDGNDNSGNNYLNPENFRKPMTAIATSVSASNKPIIMTEFCPMLDEPREEDMVGLAHIMQVGFTDGLLNGYIAWELFYGYHSQMIGVCPGAGWDLTGEGKFVCEGTEIKIFPEYHAMRHYSKFVNPGWKVVSATTAESSLKTVAFASTAGDSVSVIVINTGKTEIKLDNPVITDMGIVTAVQSKENGAKSKKISIADCTVLPARSITTLVYSKSSATAAISGCKDETSDASYVEPVEVPSEDVVIVDYSTTTDVTTWQAMSEELAEVTHSTTALDGVSGYAVVPLAGCDQADTTGVCSYRNQLFNISEAGAKALQSCEKLVFTMRSTTTENAYVNIGGAAGSSWVDYKYGNLASGSKWSETTVPLTKEGQNGSTALTFNSNAEGINIAKIVATGCTTKSTAIQESYKFNLIDNTANAKLFDMNGNLLWSGIRGQALNDDGSLRLNVRQGMYLLKSKGSVVRAVKK